MKIKFPINLHKGLTAGVVLSLMLWFDNFSTGAWVYLALHGSYGFLWLMKDRLYPDKKWEEDVSIPYAVLVFVALGMYWIAPFILISQHKTPGNMLIAGAVALNMFGMVLHFGSDAQKYFTLHARPGLITDGFFECRNPADQMLGIERVGEIIRSSRDQTASGMINKLHQAVIHHCQGNSTGDDLTAVVIRRT